MVRTNLSHEKFYNYYKIYTRNFFKISKATLYIKKSKKVKKVKITSLWIWGFEIFDQFELLDINYNDPTLKIVTIEHKNKEITQ